MLILVFTLQIILIPALSPLGVGFIKKIKAKLQNRQGAGVFQPYKDLWKLFHKDEVISVDASWVFKLAPFIVFAVTLTVGASIPVFGCFLPGPASSDMLLIVYALALGTFFLALAGMDTGGAFGGFGASREMTLSALAEGGFIFSFLTLALITGTTNLFGISASIPSVYGHGLLPVLLSFSGFFVVALSETARFPFDNPSTHLELTMIHEAMVHGIFGEKAGSYGMGLCKQAFDFRLARGQFVFPLGNSADHGPWRNSLGPGRVRDENDRFLHGNRTH